MVDDMQIEDVAPDFAQLGRGIASGEGGAEALLVALVSPASVQYELTPEELAWSKEFFSTLRRAEEGYRDGYAFSILSCYMDGANMAAKREQAKKPKLRLVK